MRTSPTLVSEVPVAGTVAAVDTSHAQAVEPLTSSPVATSSVPSTRASEAIAAVYRALTVHMTSSTSYQGARTATLNAARDLYGALSTQRNTAAVAWSAVAVS